MTSSLPTRVLAGVTIPDTPLVTKALKFARQHSTDYTYNHLVRSLLLGTIISDKVPETKDRDLEVYAVSAVLHDLGFPIGHPPHSQVLSDDKRFEVDGANAARAFLKREAESKDWDKHRLQLVWDAIALHTIGSVVFFKEPEVQACAYGIWADFQGPDRVPSGLLTWNEYNAVVKVGLYTFHSSQSDTHSRAGIPSLGPYEGCQRQHAAYLQDEAGHHLRQHGGRMGRPIPHERRL